MSHRSSCARPHFADSLFGFGSAGRLESKRYVGLRKWEVREAVNCSAARDGSVKYDLALSLELLKHVAESLEFRTTLRNLSSVKLLFPYPEIHELRFRNKATDRESEWYTEFFVSSDWGGFTLNPGEVKVIEYRVRPCGVESPTESDFTDYARWCVELPPGEYLVWFRYRVGKDYFCCDSHYHYDDLLREAKSEQAIVWSGEARSNQLHLVRPE